MVARRISRGPVIASVRHEPCGVKTERVKWTGRTPDQRLAVPGDAGSTCLSGVWHVCDARGFVRQRLGVAFFSQPVEVSLRRE